MYISYKAHNPKEHGTSSKGMINYLTKEDQSKEQSKFFNNDKQNVSFEQAYNDIDNNKGSHGNNVSKFYMMNISPSEKELRHLDKVATDMAKDKPISDLSKEESKQIYYEKLLQEYTNKTMDNYAKNFDRGKTVDDLVYYAKIEHKRDYKATDKFVKHNKKIDNFIKDNPKQREKLEQQYKRNESNEIIREGMPKDGLNTHIHVVVSRYEKGKDLKEKMSLSPMSKARKSTGVNNSKVGFDRDKLNQKSEDTFDQMFDFKREQRDKYEEHKKEFKKDSSQEQSNSSGLADDIKDYYLNVFKTALRDNKAIDSSIPTSLDEVKDNIVSQVKNELGYKQATDPTSMLTDDLKNIIGLTDKGIDLGF